MLAFRSFIGPPIVITGFVQESGRKREAKGPDNFQEQDIKGAKPENVTIKFKCKRQEPNLSGGIFEMNIIDRVPHVSRPG